MTKNKKALGTKIIDTVDSYQIIDEFYQQAEDSLRGYKTIFGSFMGLFIVFLSCGVLILYFFASTTVLDCKETTKANLDEHSNAIVSCEATRKYLFKADNTVLSLTPVQGVRLTRSDDTCRVELIGLSGNNIPLTAHYSSTQCGIDENVRALNDFIKSKSSPQYGKRYGENKVAKNGENLEQIQGFRYGGYFMPIVGSLVFFFLSLRCLFFMLKKGVMTRIEFDKRQRILTFHYKTALKGYTISYPFNEVVHIFIKFSIDTEDDTEKVSKHRILTADDKLYKIEASMSADEARTVHSKMCKILNLPDIT